MSTKSCPQCGSNVPAQARFCGQCGQTFAEGSARRIPTTLDEATGAPAPVSQPAPVRPHAGIPTSLGHAAVPAPSPGLGPGPSAPGGVETSRLVATPPAAAPPKAGPTAPTGAVESARFAASPVPAPAPTPRTGIPTIVGSAVSPAAAKPSLQALGAKTLFDPAPFGAEAPAASSQPAPPPPVMAPSEGSAVTRSQRPTPMVPPAVEPVETIPHAHHAKTVSDPDIGERAAQLRDAAVAEAKARADANAPPAPPAPSPPVPFGKTLVLGGVSAADLLPPELAPPASNRKPATEPTQASPLSHSVFAPTGVEDPRAVTSAPVVAAAPNAPPSQPRFPAASPAHAAPLAAGVAPGSDKRTMLGMPATELPLAEPPAAPAEPPVFAPAMKTMMGVAMPGIAPLRDPAPPTGAASGTLLGVAVPGIAPVQPGQPAPPRSPERHAAVPPTGAGRAPQAPPIVPPPAPLVHEPLPEAPRRKKSRGVPAIAVVAIVFVLVVVVGGAGAYFVLRAGAPLTAQPLLDESGKESLRIHCESCPDGTTITLGVSTATVAAKGTVLPLPAPLSIGDNDLAIQIDRPAPGRDETVKVHVPVAYRVKADLSTLTGSPPSITVRVEASAGTEVTVDGKPVALDPGGRAAQAIDVSAEVDGPSDEQTTIDKKIPFAIKTKGSSSPEAGQLVVRAGVIRLHLDAPGREFFTDRASAAIVGQTKPGATFTVDGQAVALDPQGRFAIRADLGNGPADKTLTLVASAPPLAPRTFRARVVRVASLDDAAKALDAKAPLAFDAFGPDPKAQAGKLAVVEGEVVEARIAQGFTVILVDERKGCAAGASCLVRIVHGEEVRAARGDAIRAYGRILGSVSAAGKSVPDLEGSLVIVKPGSKK